MNLRDYINQYPRTERARIRADIAKAAGVTEAAVRHWASGKRKPFPDAERLARITRATGGQVSPRDLRPDVFLETRQ